MKTRRIGAVIILAFMLLTQVASVTAVSTPLTMANWIETMNKTPTPGIGCWTASYPNIAWLPTACVSEKFGPFTVGKGNDESASSINYAVTGATGYFTSESGYSSESDSIKGPDWYSIQLNALNHSTTFAGNPTYGAEQFILENNGFPTYLVSHVLIEFWLFHYATRYGSCPSGWTQASAGACYINSGATTYGYEDPAYLTSYTMSGSVTSSTDTGTFCDANKGTCAASTDSDRINLYNGNWWGTEFNILGWANGSQANFNSGISVGLKTDNFENGESCSISGISGETNNLNLGTCSGGSSQQYITFSES